MKVKVWNDNQFDHREKYNGDMIHIPAGGFVYMEPDEATNFLGNYVPILKDGNDQQLPQSMKILRIERDVGQAPVVKQVFQKCHACGEEFQSKALLGAHIEEKHMDALVEDEVKEEIVKKKGKKASA